jgi:hypothetical protein
VSSAEVGEYAPHELPPFVEAHDIGKTDEKIPSRVQVIRHLRDQSCRVYEVVEDIGGDDEIKLDPEITKAFIEVILFNDHSAVLKLVNNYLGSFYRIEFIPFLQAVYHLTLADPEIKDALPRREIPADE